ncbi:hypothetical protein GYMLUDRAFT_249975 [Collybiopsis luxurians FD-317 M1]|uniref:Uncharacterized protein n=1 Tax=Collybiopsis luxurians FD-317 M1 TaxID=944289 RepID=A0A0D0BGV1_9AGAR|nr:hypothetical protein GYMLUDRAFT_249975 [Collybiopsis luxurians FD-317 M1]
MSTSAAAGGSTKQASEAAAAAIAAKIAAQFASGGGAMAGGLNDAAFTHDIDINDARNSYMLCKSSTRQEIQDETGASISTKGTWHPNRSKATEKDPPLYLHIMAPSKEVLDKAIAKWPEEKMPIGLDNIGNFDFRVKFIGPSGSFVKYVQQEPETRRWITGVGSNYIEQEEENESDGSLYIHITGPEDLQVGLAKVIPYDLFLIVTQTPKFSSKRSKLNYLVTHIIDTATIPFIRYSIPAWIMAQHREREEMEMDTAPLPPGDGPFAPPLPRGAHGLAAGPAEQHVAYRAACGYDVNSFQFKAWEVEQAKRVEQNYAQAGAGTGGGTGCPGYGAAGTADFSGAAGPGGGVALPPPPSPARVLRELERGGRTGENEV